MLLHCKSQLCVLPLLFHFLFAISLSPSLSPPEDGNLYTWGKAGPFLGYMDDSITKQTKPRLVDALYGTRIVQVACGRSHTLVIDEEGRVYSFGINKFGELGQGHDKAITKPTRVANLVSICKVSCGRHHSAAMDGMGVVNGCGLLFESCRGWSVVYVGLGGKRPAGTRGTKVTVEPYSC